MSKNIGENNVTRDMNARAIQQAKAQAKIGKKSSKKLTTFDMRNIFQDKIDAREEEKRRRDEYAKLPEFSIDWFKKEFQVEQVSGTPMEARRWVMIGYLGSKVCQDELAVYNYYMSIDDFVTNWVSLYQKALAQKIGDVIEFVGRPDGYDGGIKIMIMRRL